jgi:ribose/xylose/arabinose/galactoside ABC-type transport system permease subunit
MTFSERIQRFKSSNDASSMITVLGALVLLMVVFSLSSPHFLSVRNLLNIGLYAAIMGTVACSMTFINVSGCIDLSVGSQIAVIGMLAGNMMNVYHLPISAVIPLSLVAGLVFGAFNGFFITVFKLNPFITTLASMQIMRGICFLINDGSSYVLADPLFQFIGRHRIFGTIPLSLIIMLVCYLIFSIIGRRTVFGRTIYMVGGNPQASFLAGIKVNRVKMILYMIHGLMAGIAALLLSAQTGAALPQAAGDINMQALSAVILGGAGLAGGRGTILGTLFGVLVLCTLNNGMVMLNIPSFWQQVVIGTVLIISVSIDAIKGGSLKKKI